MQPGDIAFFLMAVACVAIVIVVPIVVIRLFRRASGVPQELQAMKRSPGMVHFVFHQYSGFLVFVVQKRYGAVLSTSDADALLRRLVRHNLTWGLFAYGGLFVPVLTYCEWRSQKKRIAAARAECPEMGNQG
jgi:hypothetical protein